MVFEKGKAPFGDKGALSIGVIRKGCYCRKLVYR
jgi:hypothetical protein